MKEHKFGLFLAIVLAGLFVAGGVILASNINSSVTVGNAAPTVSSVVLNGAGTITLVSNATKAVNVTAIVADNNGCPDLTGGTTTIVLYRTGLTSTCTTNDLNCYRLTAFTASSTCFWRSDLYQYNDNV